MKGGSDLPVTFEPLLLGYPGAQPLGADSIKFGVELSFPTVEFGLPSVELCLSGRELFVAVTGEGNRLVGVVIEFERSKLRWIRPTMARPIEIPVISRYRFHVDDIARVTGTLTI